MYEKSSLNNENTSKKAHIVEIFNSIQGEGLFVGEMQTFVRFSGCNLNCAFCDTNHKKEISKEMTAEELANTLKEKEARTVSLTGGEPLLHSDFIKELTKKYSANYYLETNGTLWKKLEDVLDCVNTVAMDIKLKSATGEENRFEDNQKFADIAASAKNFFIKIVFDKNITNEEIESCIKIASKNNTTVILQPKMPMDKDFVPDTIFSKFYAKYENIRLIPQTHKFLNIR